MSEPRTFSPDEIIRKTLSLTYVGLKAAPDGVAKSVILKGETKATGIPAGAPKGLHYFIASTEAVDRSNDIIIQSGWDFSYFKKNPVWMNNHNYSKWPLGKIPYIKVIAKRLWIGVDWDMEDPEAAFIQGKYARGYAAACSVGFKAKKWAYRDDDNRWRGGIEFQECMLTEVSPVPIGCNQEALDAGPKSDDIDAKGSTHDDLLALIEGMGEQIEQLAQEVKSLTAAPTGDAVSAPEPEGEEPTVEDDQGEPNTSKSTPAQAPRGTRLIFNRAN